MGGGEGGGGGEVLSVALALYICTYELAVHLLMVFGIGVTHTTSFLGH